MSKKVLEAHTGSRTLYKSGLVIRGTEIINDIQRDPRRSKGSHNHLFGAWDKKNKVKATTKINTWYLGSIQNEVIDDNVANIAIFGIICIL
jgi:hypothetical protein